MGDFQIFSPDHDEDSLEDHISAFEDFKSVQLEMNVPMMCSPVLTQGDLPHIAVTPMTPPREQQDQDDDGHSTISLNSTAAPSPALFPGQIISGLNNYWRPESPLLVPSGGTEAQDFFAYRDSIIRHVIDEVQNLVSEDKDGHIKGTWLLTE